MASSPSGGRRIRGVRLLPRACVVAGVAAAALLQLAAGAVPAAHAARSGSVQAQSQPGLRLSVTSMSTSYARPNHTITLAGRIRNVTRSAISGLSVQLNSSSYQFSSNTALEAFAAGTLQVPEAQLAATPESIAKVRAGQEVGWSMRLPVNSLGLTCFGVYPLTVTVSNATGTQLADAAVPLPFWPNKSTSCQRQARPNPFLISWIWPLIDVPHQGPCPGLLDNSLAASLAPGGRLWNLRSIGATFAASAHLTWAIDPALVDNVQTMTRPYRVGGSASCTRGRLHGADPNAKKWLADLKANTSGHPVFVTPYADVDVAGLAEYGDNTDLRNAFAIGQQLAGPLLDRGKMPAPIPAGLKQLSSVAWPANGRASLPVLENLGARGLRIGTVILAMPRPPSEFTYTPGAVTSVVDGVGGMLKVLLADSSLSSLLASSSAVSNQPGTIFSVSQLFEAETAWIVAEAPAMQRPIVVTPPRRWDPASSLASQLLSDTVNAPWLRPAPIGQLGEQPQETDYSSTSLMRTNAAVLPAKVLGQVAKLDRDVSLLQSIMTSSDVRLSGARLSHAVYGIESSAWTGGNASRSSQLLSRTEQYITRQFADLSVGGRPLKVIHVTLGGKVGSVTVSIHSLLSYPVRVGLQVTSSSHFVTVTQPHRLYLVEPDTSTPLKLKVSASQTGKATLRLRIVTRYGVLLPDPPDKPLVMTISATNLGTVALVIFAAALAVFVAASAAQALRRGRAAAGEPRVSPQPSAAGPGNQLADQDLPNGPVQPDNVFTARTELRSIGTVIADQGTAAQASRPTEES
jgi:hypothetical protein